ncbi:hypothetical protein [Streptomyces pseudovenezuelae]|uniref:hypothetical protein n=1 Tax=Streptomyces pseudovenezuelae TaxID=67350 RepID=UPI0036E56038
METRTTPTPADLPARPLFDRKAWEEAVMCSGLHHTARLTAFALAHHAVDGCLPADDVQYTPRMAERTGLTSARARQCLRDLQKAGLIRRPPSGSWTASRDQARPITLTIPPVPARREPPSTGAVPE